MRKIFIVSLIFFLCACSIRVPQNPNYVNIIKPYNLLDKNAVVYIIYPKAFVEDQGKQTDSSWKVGEKILAEFKKNSITVLASKDSITLEDGFDLATSSNATYLITSSITKWEDRVPGNILDRLDIGEIIISTYDVRTRELLQQSIIGGRGSSVTINFIPIGTHGPEDCLTDGLASWISILYGDAKNL
jgi:hypothetical protein